MTVDLNEGREVAESASSGTTITVTSLEDTFAMDGLVTLREALQAANTDTAFNEAPAGSGADTIEFDPDLFTVGAQTLTLSGAELAITDHLTITGPGDDLLTIDANDLSRVFKVDGSGTLEVTLSGMTITGGDVDDSGGGIYNREHLRIEDVTITDNYSDAINGGGGVYNYGGTLEVVNCTVTSNRTSRNGGGILGSTNSVMTVTGSVISDNYAFFEGGGAGVVHGGSLTITDSTITNNTSEHGGGGGLYARWYNIDAPVSLTVTRCTISNNWAKSWSGGGIYGGIVALNITDSTISDNRSGDKGGGVYHVGSGTIIGSTITGNLGNYGGGIYINADDSFSITDTTIADNTAYQHGGGIYKTYRTLTITGSTISGNTGGESDHGGGIYSEGGLIITNSTISGNTIAGDSKGGGIYLGSGPLTLFSSTVADNSAGAGGGVFVASGTQTMQHTIVADNSATAANPDLTGTMAGDYNLVEDISGAFLLGSDNITGVDPGLEPLADNGGPTWTHALMPDSPAVDARDPDFDPSEFTPPLDTDQRGRDRVDDGDDDGQLRIDVGAYERATNYTAPPNGDRYYLYADDALHRGVVNGTFELGDLTGWTTYTAEGGTLGGPGFPDVIAFDVDVDSVETETLQLLVGNGGGGICQNIALAGGDVKISVDVAAQGQVADPEGGLFEVLLDGTVVATHDFGAIDAGQTQRAQLSVTLSDIAAGNYEIRIHASRSGPAAYGSSPFGYIDNVMVVGAADGVLANDYGSVSELRALLVSAPEHGTLEFRPDGSFAYTPGPGFSGEDRFVYKAVEGAGGLTFYSVDTENDKLITIDSETAEVSLVGAIGHDMYTVDMTYDNGVLYVLNVGGGAYELVTIDPATGAKLTAIPLSTNGVMTAAKGITAADGSLYVNYAVESAYCGNACGAAHILGRLDADTGVISGLVNYRSLDGGFNHDFHALATDAEGRIIASREYWDTIRKWHLGFDPPSLTLLGGGYPPDASVNDTTTAGSSFYVLNTGGEYLHRYEPEGAGYGKVLENIPLGPLGSGWGGLAYAPDLETNAATVTIVVHPVDNWSTTITNVEQLQLMALDLTADYVLANDIDASETVHWNGVQGFDAVGDVSAPFTGTFDGAGFAVANLRMVRPGEEGTGLFGATDGAVLTGISLTDAAVSGGDYTGLLVGYARNGTTIIDCHVEGVVSGDDYTGGLMGLSHESSIVDSSASVEIVGNRYVGGLVGLNQFGPISQSRATVDAKATSAAGGLVGANNGTGAVVTRCYATGSVSLTSGAYNSGGGFVGYQNQYGRIQDCYAQAAVTGSAANSRVGGFSGTNQGGVIKYAYAAGSVGDGGYVGGLVGNNGEGNYLACFWDTESSGTTTGIGLGESDNEVVGKNTAEMMAQGTFVAWDFTTPVWKILEQQTLPFLAWQVQVVGRHVFYNNSEWDREDQGPGAEDDQAVAWDKRALLPGEVARFENYTSYSRGINGVMVDVGNLPDGYVPVLEDFGFKVGNDSDPAGWDDAPDPTTIAVREAAGEYGSDRVTIIWDDYAIRGQWLEVTVREGTGIGRDVFYFGNAVGEAGNLTTDAQVTTTDLLLARNNPRHFMDPAGIDFPYDYNRDKLVNSTDVLLARNNQTDFMNWLNLIDLSGGKALESSRVRETHQAADQADVDPSDVDPSGAFHAPYCFDELERMGRQTRPSEKDDPARRTVDVLLAAGWLPA